MVNGKWNKYNKKSNTLKIKKKYFINEILNLIFFC